MGYVVLHLDKAPGNEAKMTAHIARTVIPPNCNPALTHLNTELIEYPEEVADRTEAIQHRLDTAGLERKIGTNQVRAIRVMLTGSHEDMKRIEAEGRLDDWCADNLDWLRDTYGADNVVSAFLHLDEGTPHIHATVVPIVTGERRKVKEKKKEKEPEKPGKKTYRKKSRDAVRLCADDVMTRVKLKEYQNTYAEAMAKYGLQRGIDGSEARHITTQEFYRSAIAQKQNLQENIELLLQAEESKRKHIEELDQKEREAIYDYKQASELKQQKESELGETQAALKEVKGQLTTEKLKNTAAEVGSNIIEGIGAVIGKSKVKRQQEEIDSLKAENETMRTEKDKEIKHLKEQLRSTEAEHKSAIGKLSEQLEKIYELFPHIKDLLKWDNFLRNMGLPQDMVRRLFNREEVVGSGELYSKEHSQKFKAKDATIKLEQDQKEPSKIRLTINGTDIFDWFKQKHHEFLQAIGINVKQGQGKGMKMS